MKNSRNNPTTTILKSPYTCMGISIFVFLLSQIFVPGIILKLLNIISPTLAQNPSAPMISAYAGMYLIGFPIVLLILNFIPDNKPDYKIIPKQKLKFPSILALYAIGTSAMTIISMITGMIESMMGTTATVTTQDLAQSGVSSSVYFILGVIVAPIMEELVFRYLTYKKLSGYNAKAYIIWSAIVFGLFHLNFGQSIYATLLGVILAIVMYNTGSIVYSMIIHILINLFAGVGIGSIILRTNNLTMISFYGMFNISIILIGLILGIIFIVKKKFKLNQQNQTNPDLKIGFSFLNIGTVIYLIFTIAIIVLGFLK